MSARYGCFNRAPFLLEQRMAAGHVYIHNERINLEAIVPFRMSPDCNYTLTDLGRADAKCADCKHKAKDDQQAVAAAAGSH